MSQERRKSGINVFQVVGTQVIFAPSDVARFCAMVTSIPLRLAVFGSR